MALFSIKSRYEAKVLFELECGSLKLCVEAAAKGGADLGGADLRGADFGGAYLGGAYLGGAYLGGADLRGAYLGGAYLGGADLGGADLRGAYLGGAYLGGADLGGADLGGADLRGADLRGADLRGADFGGADLGGADLGGAKIDWQNHSLVSEILWREAEGDVEKEMLAALIGRKTDWCWKRWLEFETPHREWAISAMAKWVTDDDGAPDILRRLAERAKTGKAEAAAATVEM